MPLILHIDTATEIASIALSRDEKVLQVISNENMKDHAAWIHNAINSILQANDHKLTDLNAVSVVDGPGSYTGLRVGMATAKGVCYALNIPLITESSLRLMASAVLHKHVLKFEKDVLLVPMIDARRSEVFTAAFDINLIEIIPPAALILDGSSFSDLAQKHQPIFFGSGSEKFRQLTSNDQFKFMDLTHDAADLFPLAYQKFREQNFADLAYSEPAYLKEFYTHTKK